MVKKMIQSVAKDGIFAIKDSKLKVTSENIVSFKDNNL